MDTMVTEEARNREFIRKTEDAREKCRTGEKPDLLCEMYRVFHSMARTHE